MIKHYSIIKGNKITFNNNALFCIGTGRMGLALHKAYQEQLKFVQDNIHFSHIRGHGLFSDDIAIYQEYKDDFGNMTAEYNFTYLDMVMDSYLELGIRPFLELGFMPQKLASGDQTVFYWKGNVTPPKNYEGWRELVQATLSHLMERYGKDEVVKWPIEVWNEPNLSVFWKDADKQEYFKLYEFTAKAIKDLDKRFKIGGPAICGVDDVNWMKDFMNFCHESSAPIDFVTRHAYATEAPEHIGHYGYQELREPEDLLRELQITRDIVDRYEEYRGMDIHITEFNTSYIPNCPLHDQNVNAAYIAKLLSSLGDCNASYSYWTFGDIFEENGVPFTPFHGGFGLVANGVIPKPTFWTFAFFKELQGECVHKSEESIIVQTQDGSYRGVAWNLIKNTEAEQNLELNITLPMSQESCLLVKTVDETCCNPLKIWHDIGEPAHPTPAQNALLRASSMPLVTTERVAADKEKITINLSLSKNALTYFEIFPVNQKSDRGYIYSK